MCRMTNYYSFHRFSFLIGHRCITRIHSSRMRTTRLLPVSPSMHCSLGRLPAQGGVSAQLPGGTCPGGVSAQGGTCLGGCTCPGGVPAQGVYLPRGGVPTQGGVPARGVPAKVPPREQNERQVQKYYLAPNFVCGR